MLESYRLPFRRPARTIAALAVVGVMFAAQLAIGAAQASAPPGGGAATAADRVLTNGEHFPNGFVVPAGQTWVFDQTRSTTVTAAGNVTVYGRLEMKPSAESINHTLTFTGINESKFVGHQMNESMPIATDVGLWVLGNGVLDIQGTQNVPWSYTYQSGWAGDEVRRAPVAPGDHTSFPTVTSTPSANSMGYKPELLNLTRNVNLQGTPGGKTHILINSTQPQNIAYATIANVAPDLDGGVKGGSDKTGRYGLHFHFSGDGSRGSLVEGVVIRDADNHAYVPHASHGITLRNTIAYDTTAEAYWWDESTQDVCGESADCMASDDTVYDGVVAALTETSPYSKHTGSAIQLGAGQDNTVVNSVAVGMQGRGENNAGFQWPSKDHGVWIFRNNIAHNNAAHGAFVWQNSGSTHLVDGFTAYNNRHVAVDHGAYHNPYVFRNSVFRGNEDGSIESHALGKEASDGGTDTQVWENLKTGGTGILKPQPHNNIGSQTRPVRFVHCDFAKIVFEELGGKSKSTATGGVYDFVQCGLTVSDFDLKGASNAAVIRVQDGNTAYRLTGAGVKTTISTFHQVNPPLPPPTPPTGPPPTTTTTTAAPPTTSPTTTPTTAPTTTAPPTTVPTTTTAPPPTTTAAPPTTTTQPPTTTTRPRDRPRDRTTTTRRPRGGGLAAETSNEAFLEASFDGPSMLAAPVTGLAAPFDGRYFCGISAGLV